MNPASSRCGSHKGPLGRERALASLPGQTAAMTKTYHLGPTRRAVNLLMKPLVRLGVGGKATYLLTTTGRKTGEPRTTPVILVEDTGERWLVSPYGTVAWVYNVRAHPDVTLRHGKRRNRFTLMRSIQSQPLPSSSVTFATCG